MTYDEFSKKYKLKPVTMTRVVPGLGILPSSAATVNNRTQHSVAIVGASHTYMHLVFIEDAHCLALYPPPVKLTKNYTDEERSAILVVLNNLLEELGAPVEVVYDATHKVFVLYNKISNTWSFKLDYAYKSPKYLSYAQYSRVEAHSWQNPGTRGSNTLEGKFDPDVALEGSTFNDTVKIITENLA